MVQHVTDEGYQSSKKSAPRRGKTSALFATVVFGVAIGATALRSEGANWGPEAGPMAWSEAQTHCRARGMRLPTRNELLDLFKSGEHTSWKYAHYWTNEEAAPDWAHEVHITGGTVEAEFKTEPLFVRCVR